MTFALYKEKNNKPLRDFDSIVTSFDKGDVEFIRWDFEKNEGFLPEFTDGQHGSLIILKADNPRVTPFHTGEEITEMFSTLLNDVEPEIIATSNDGRTHVISVEFPEME